MGNVCEVIIARSNPVTYDPRTRRILRALSKRFNTLVLGWDREHSSEPYEFGGGRIQIKRLGLKAPYGKLTIVAYYPIFWTWLFVNLIAYRPRIVHSCDFDTLAPCLLFKTLFGRKVVYDSFDRYAMAYISNRFGLLYKAVDHFEEFLAGQCDALITVSQERMRAFRQRPNASSIVMNCPEDYGQFEKQTSNQDVHQGLFLVYAGIMTQDRGLRLMDEAVRSFSDVYLTLAGRSIGGIIQSVLRNPKVSYLGIIDHSKALDLQAKADAVLLLYDPAVPINRVASPNKLFEAMMLGVPVISNVCRDIVNETGCGIVIDYDLHELRTAIEGLRKDPRLGAEMGRRGRLAYENTFNWGNMESRLFSLYDALLKCD